LLRILHFTVSHSAIASPTKRFKVCVARLEAEEHSERRLSANMVDNHYNMIH